MGHNIAENSGQAAIMYVGEPPWHGLGIQLSAPATAADAIRAARLDWKVEKATVHLKISGKERAIPNKFAVIRSDLVDQPDAPALGIVGEDYCPLQNRDAFTWFDPIVGANAAVYHTAGALGEGERIWILAKLPGEIRVIGDDVSEKYLLLSNSHDGTSGVQIKFTPIRVVCQNTLTMALSDGPTLRVKHNRHMDERLQLARQNLGIITTRFKRIETEFQRLAKVQVSGPRLQAYLSDVFPEPLDADDERARARVFQNRELCGKLFETGRGNQLPHVRGTLWAAYNSVAEAVDFHFRSRSPENRLESIWFGGGYLTKARAFRLALEKVDDWKN